MIDKKQLIEDLLECVNDATDTQTAMTGMTMCAMLMNEVLDEALTTPDVSQAKRTVCPDCFDRGELRNDKEEIIGTCPCHY